MSSEPITYHEYWKEVRSLADEVLKLASDAEDEDAIYDILHETIDGHQWVIYTAYNYQVLAHSENDGYAIENWGVETAIRDGRLATEALAFGALYGDVSDRIGELREERATA